MVAQSPEPGAHVLNARAFRIELEFRNVKETSVFSFDDVVLSKGGFLDNKIVNVRG